MSTKKASTKAKSTGKAKGGKNKAAAARILNCLPSPNAEQDWGLAQATAAGVVAKAGPLPAKVDLRDETWWPIFDQGGTGSCVGQAAAGGMLRWHFVKAGRLDKAAPLSTRYVWMAAKETDALTSQATTFIDADGTTLKAALDVARKFGVVTEDLLPFMGTGLYAGDVKTFYAIAATRKVASYYRLQPGDWKRWLADSGPILCRLDVDAEWDNVGADGKLNTYRGNGRGGHAVCLVGYDGDRFVVRNSWGTSWGDKGYAYASTAYASKAFTEAYGVKL
jgi:hypothetical protein